MDKEMEMKLESDKADIIAALDYRSGPDSCNSLYLGSMATHSICQAFGGSLGDVGFDLRKAIKDGTRRQVDKALESCASVIEYMKKHPTGRCPTCGTKGIDLQSIASVTTPPEAERKAEARIAVLEQACGAAAVSMYLDMTGEQIAESAPGSPFLLACAAVGLDPIGAPEKILSVAAKIRADGHVKGPQLVADSGDKLIRVITEFLRDRDEGVMPDEIDEGERLGSAQAILERIADLSALDVWRPTHRHVKRGTEYRVVGTGKMQAENWWERNPNRGQSTFGECDQMIDMRKVVIYRSGSDGSLWVRPVEEFNDGRFEPVDQERD